MKYLDFKKVGSILASAAMLGATAGIAAAAAYPGTYTANSGNDTAIVVGSSADALDFTAATDIGANLNAVIAATGATGGEPNLEGETFALFTNSKIYMNDSINVIRSSLTKSNLPTILEGGEISGNVESDYSLKIAISSNPRVTFEKHYDEGENPVVGVVLGSDITDEIYNMTIVFNPAIDFTSSDTQGEELMLFGETFTISSATTEDKLVLLKSSQKLSLSISGSNPNPSEVVTIDGKTYTVELIGGNDDAATIKVTDSDGNFKSRSVNEAASRKIQGLEVAVNTVEESSLESVGIFAEISVGADRISFEDGEEVTITSSDTDIENTNVGLTGGTNKTTKIAIEVAAVDDDVNSITPGNPFIDPVFGSFKIDFAGLNIANEDSSREDIAISYKGEKEMTVSFTDYNGDSITNFAWVYNGTDSSGGGMQLNKDKDGIIHVLENEAINKTQYVMLGNEDEGGLFLLSSLKNTSCTIKIKLIDEFNQEVVTHEDSTCSTTGDFSVKGIDYDYIYADAGTSNAQQLRIKRKSEAHGVITVFPTIETSKGAKFAFYEPTIVNLADHNGNGTSSITTLRFPDGDGYTSFTTAMLTDGNWTFSTGGTNLSTELAEGASQVTGTVGQLTYAFNTTGTLNQTRVYLQDTSSTNILKPAIVLFEEKADNPAEHNAIIVTLDAGYDGSSDGLGIDEFDRTWSSDAQWESIQLESDDDLYTEMDLWGTILNTDKSDNKKTEGVISYPDDQVYAQIYFSAADATVSAGDGSGGNIIPVYDNQNVAGKNLIVVGGSCVNTIAAELLGSSSPLCGPDFTETTTVGAGEFLIETFARTGGKIATLVAGYNAADTTAASAALISQKPDVDAGSSFKGDSTGTLTAM